MSVLVSLCAGRAVTPPPSTSRIPFPNLPSGLPDLLPPYRPHPPHHKHTVDSNGLPFKSPDDESGYIIGGQPTGRGKWPWVVAIDFTNTTTWTREFVCGGVYVDLGNRKWVLTAAHCVAGAPYVKPVEI